MRVRLSILLTKFLAVEEVLEMLWRVRNKDWFMALNGKVSSGDFAAKVLWLFFHFII